MNLMLGSHLSIAGGMVNALDEAGRLKLDCVQVFTKNQRQWKVPPLKDSDREDWLEGLDRLGWRGDEAIRVISHNSYLINMASPEKEISEKSIALQTEELERCEQLEIPLCVAHPGAHLGKPRRRGELNTLGGDPSRDELAGLKRIARALDRIHRDLSGYETVTCLETTVGSGTNLGYDFSHLAWIRQNVREPERIAFCFDTCHVTAAGYDMSTPDGASSVMDIWDTICGNDHLAVFHFNDSKGAVGSRIDRHEHIGKGTCGRSCFRHILQEEAFAGVPKILETAKEQDDRGRDMDRVNVDCLKRIARGRPSRV
ncbi:MAG: deoxyribonuclease IV [Phycisphaerae bacterium]|nr:deoxyribonuclease IV [Phycisphaerae bacterium]